MGTAASGPWSAPTTDAPIVRRIASTRPPAASARRSPRRTPTIGSRGVSVVAGAVGAAVWAVIRVSVDGSSSGRNAKLRAQTGIGPALWAAMSRVTRLPGPARDRSRSLSEVETYAWLLENSIPVPGLGGRSFGFDAVIGLIPVFGDLVGGVLTLFVVWRASRMGLPRIVVARMLINAAIDIVVGAIPFAGDAFDLWFKANTRNLGLARRWLAEPGRSTRDEWLSLLLIVGILVGI